MKKKIFSVCIIVLVLTLALFVLSACNAADTTVGTELVSNGAFEDYTLSSDDKLSFKGWSIGEDWTNSSYGRQPVTTTEQESDLELGTGYLKITNSKGGWAYLYQSVKVDRKVTYKITVDIKLMKSITTGSDDTFKGAHVTFLENTGYVFAEELKAQNDNYGWVTKTFYVRPVNTDYMTICLALGAEDATSVGTAYFDNVSMQRVESVADGYSVVDFKKAKIARYKVDVSGVVFVLMLSLLTVALAACAYILIRRNYARPDAFLNFDQNAGRGGKVAAEKIWWKNTWFFAGMLALGTFAVRLIFLLSMYGFGGETNTIVDLAKNLGANGVADAYTKFGAGTKVATMAPGTLYILAAIGGMGQNLQPDGVSILLRMVNVLADIAVVLTIYFYGRKYVGNKMSTIYAALYSLMPVTLVMGGLNPTFESVLVALVLVGFVMLVEKKYLPMYLVFTLAILLDIRALAVVPLAVAYLVYMYYRADNTLKSFGAKRATILFGFVGCFVLLYLLTLPVAINNLGDNPFFGYKAIANQMLNYPYLTDNALGLYGMVGMNRRLISDTAAILNLVFLLILVMYVISLYVKKRNRQELIMLASFTFAVIAVFTLKNNFTYLFLSIALGLIYTMISGDKRMYGILAGYALLSFLCVGQIINNSGFASVTSDGYLVNFESTGADYIIFSIFAVLLTGYYAYVSYSISNNNKIVDIIGMPRPFKATFKSWVGSVFSKRNAIDAVKKD